jgi:tetratricopeptide (TPR) repeat protein
MHHDDAASEYEAALRIDPNAGNAQRNLALARSLAQAHENADAAGELRKAQAIDAPRANRFVTGILRLPPNDTNLDRLLQQLGNP